MPDSQRFCKRERLRLKTDFARVFAARRSAADDALVVYALPNQLAFSRLGIVVSRRIGNAPQRSYVRRRIREAFRTNKPGLSSGLDIICVARPPAAEANVSIARSLSALIDRAAARRGSNRNRCKPQELPDGAHKRSDRDRSDQKR
ncbi:MAG: ribonuclease P protein component [Planctomycetes bacterium]|nr:ribonuclease P protein component [Planctomycetota bacterium]